MVARERLYTAEDLLALPHDRGRYALVEGQLIEMSPTGKPHGLVTNEIAFVVTAFARLHDLGQVFGAETGFRVGKNPDTVYGIDVAFVSKARKQTGEGYFEGAPDLAVEVFSPSNSQTEIHDKIKRYFQAGSRLVWVFYPQSRAVYVYKSPTDIKVLNENDTLDGGEVLPGFAVKIGDIFAVLDNS
ncbi:MAG TPA: Uma2 family endonuclease [Aggregatilineales bacterium]|nr:Uma2 family endonuclease [Aggregatilineales bacterium]